MTNRLSPLVPAASVTGFPTTRPNRNLATQSSPGMAESPVARTKTLEGRTEISTLNTKADGKTYEIYSGDREWADLILTLRTAGPVAVGNKQHLGAVLSGGGEILIVNQPRKFTIHKGTKMYYAASAVSLVSVEIQPPPWVEQIAAGVERVIIALTGGKP